MGEAKDRAEEIEAMKKQEEEFLRKQKEADEQLRKLSETYLSKEEAEKRFADNKLEAMKLSIVRRKWEAQIVALRDQVSQIEKQIALVDDRLTQLSFDDALTFRRTLNPENEPAKMGEPVGGDVK